METLLTISDLPLEKVHRDAIENLQSYLSKAQHIPNVDSKIQNWKRWQKYMEHSLEILKKQQLERLKFQEEFAREFIEVNKVQAINVGGPKKRLQSVSFATGEQKELEIVSKAAAEKRKKRKKAKTTK